MVKIRTEPTMDCDNIRLAALLEAAETDRPVTYISWSNQSCVVAPEQARSELLQFLPNRSKRFAAERDRLQRELAQLEQTTARYRAVVALAV